jgi:zinc protease
MFRFLLRTALLAALAAQSHAAIDPARPIPVGPQVKVGKLDNGLTYYIQRNATPARRLELRLVVKAGSVLEDDDQQGLAHVVEHMAFNGSTHFRKHELVAWLQSIGVQWGADLNAYTGFDETVYLLPIPTAGHKENIDKAFTVLEDWAHGLALADDAIESERAIVLEELRLRQGAGERIERQLRPMLVNGARYAVRPPIGQEASLRSYRPEAVRRFYRDWYRPELMAVVVVGDIDPGEAERLVKAHFAGLANPPLPRPRKEVAIAAQERDTPLVVTDKEAPTDWVSMRYPLQRVPKPATFGAYRERLLEDLVGSMLNQRLQELAQMPAAPISGGGAGIERLYSTRYRTFQSSAVVGTGGPAASLRALALQNMQAREYGFSAAELDLARKRSLRFYEGWYDERTRTDSAIFAAEYIRNFLEDEAIPGAEAEFRLVRELLAAVTLDDVNAAARALIPAGGPKLVFYTGRERTDLAPAPQLLAAAQEPAAAQDPSAAAPQSAPPAPADTLRQPAPPRPGRIVAETRDRALGLTRLTLSNGVKVILKPTDFRNDEVLLGAMRSGGVTQFASAWVPDARMASDLVAAMGIPGFSPLDLQKAYAGTDFSVGLNLGTYTDEVSARAGGKARDIEAMLQVLWLKFTGVRRDPLLYKAFIDRGAEGARIALAQPDTQMFEAARAAIYGSNPYMPHARRPEEVEQVSLERGIALFRERFASARGLTFVLVGKFDPAAVKPLLATWLGSLPTPPIPLAVRDVGLNPVRGVVKREVHAGTEAKGTIVLDFTGPTVYSDREEQRLSALVDLMNMRITEVLRTRLGLIYAGGMSREIQRIPSPRYTVEATLPTSPDKVDQVLAALFAEIARMKADGPSVAELDKLKRTWREMYHNSLRQNGFWLARLQASVFDGFDPHRIVDFDRRIDALTVADVRSAARHYLDTANYVQVVAWPESYAAAATPKTTAAAYDPEKLP